MEPTETMREYDAPTVEEFAEILRRKRPAILRGAVDDWPALEKWSLAHLAAATGQREVRVTHSAGGVYDAPTYSMMTMREFVDILSGSGRDEGQYYITGVELASDLPELAGDVGTPAVLAELDMEHRHFFLGRDSVTGCHFHPNHQNLLIQLMGRKSVTLFSPADFGRLYPKPWNDRYFNWSRVGDLRQYDRSSFPDVAEARPIEVTLEPGMALHIPIHWWHFVHGQGVSASLAFFWRAPLRAWHFPHPGLRSGVRLLTSKLRRLAGRGG